MPKGMRLAREVLLAGATLAVFSDASAGAGVWAPNSSLGPQVTVYVSQPLWARGSSARSYGMRLEQVRSDAGLPRRAEFGAVHRKALIDLQVRPNAGTRLEFAARVSWDLGRGFFGPTPDGSSRVINLAFRAHKLADARSYQPWSVPIHRAALPPPLTWSCDTPSTEVAADYIRHRTEQLAVGCDALAMTIGRSALTF